MNSKAKGSAGERELAAYFAARGFQSFRNNQRYVGGHGNPDIEVDGLDDYHIEVKRVERLNISAAFKQAAADAVNRIPVVIHRRNREPWLITMALDDWIGPRQQ